MIGFKTLCRWIQTNILLMNKFNKFLVHVFTNLFMNMFKDFGVYLNKLNLSKFMNNSWTVHELDQIQLVQVLFKNSSGYRSGMSRFDCFLFLSRTLVNRLTIFVWENEVGVDLVTTFSIERGPGSVGGWNRQKRSEPVTCNICLLSTWGLIGIPSPH